MTAGNDEPNGSDDYRQWLVKAHHVASQDYDKAIMTLSSAALGLSVAFIHDVVPHPSHQWSLIASWIAFAVSLTLVTLSFLSSQYTLLRMIDEIDRASEFSGARKWVMNRATPLLNVGACIAFVAGVGALVLFASYNA